MNKVKDLEYSTKEYAELVNKDGKAVGIIKPFQTVKLPDEPFKPLSSALIIAKECQVQLMPGEFYQVEKKAPAKKPVAKKAPAKKAEK